MWYKYATTPSWANTCPPSASDQEQLYGRAPPTLTGQELRICRCLRHQCTQLISVPLVIVQAIECVHLVGAILGVEVCITLYSDHPERAPVPDKTIAHQCAAGVRLLQDAVKVLPPPPLSSPAAQNKNLNGSISTRCCGPIGQGVRPRVRGGQAGLLDAIGRSDGRVTAVTDGRVLGGESTVWPSEHIVTFSPKKWGG